MAGSEASEDSNAEEDDIGAEGLLREHDEDQAAVHELVQDASRYTYGVQHMLHRKKDEDGRWKVCESTDPLRSTDSVVHRWQREKGFRPAAADLAEIDSTAAVERAWQEQRAAEANESHPNRVASQGVFERWCKDQAGESPYTKWLTNITLTPENAGAVNAYLAERAAAASGYEEGTVTGPGGEFLIEFVPPPPVLVLAWINSLRNGREGCAGCKGGYIKNLVSGVSVTCTEFGADMIMKGAVSDKVLGFLKEDGHKPSKAFDMEADMITMWNKVWHVRTWPRLKCLLCWAMMLIGIVIAARSACITTYCPLYEDMEVPDADSAWDNDGLPKFLIIGLRKWKSRTPARCCKCPTTEKCSCEWLYRLRVHRNYLDQRFCPVFWLLLWFKYSRIVSGPIFRPIIRGGPHSGDVSDSSLTPEMWRGMTKALFIAAGLYTPTTFEMVFDVSKGKDVRQVKDEGHGVTNQGIRRSALQWAGRCGAKNVIDVKNVSRHKSGDTLAIYLAQGAKRRSEKEFDHGADPIFKTWVWKVSAMPGISNRDLL